jgi:hypothetical protein
VKQKLELFSSLKICTSVITPAEAPTPVSGENKFVIYFGATVGGKIRNKYFLAKDDRSPAISIVGLQCRHGVLMVIVEGS